jgi:hypothetical protein
LSMHTRSYDFSSKPRQISKFATNQENLFLILFHINYLTKI